MTNSQIIAQIRSRNKFLSDDDTVSDRQIYNDAKAVASILLKREISQKKLTSSDNVYTPVECLPLCKANGTECDLSFEVAKSTIQLPQIEEGLYSYFIQGVFNLDNSEEIYPTTIRDFANYQKLRVKANKNFYIIKNRYLYVLNPDIVKVNLYAYFVDGFEQDDCVSMYDREFRFPPYLLDSLYSMCRDRLLDYHKFAEDTQDNNKED